MTRRLVLSYLAITLLVLLLLEIPLAVFFQQREIDRLTAGVERDAAVMATIYEDVLELRLAPDPFPAEEYQATTGARVIVVDLGGISIVDSEREVDRDYSTRPEVASALSGTNVDPWESSSQVRPGVKRIGTPASSVNVSGSI